MNKKILLLSIFLILPYILTGQPLEIKSKDYKTKEEKINNLVKYIKTFSKVLNTEYEIFNVNGLNNGRSIPGPSNWDYRIVLKLNVKDIKYWINEFELVDDKNIDLSWGYDLIPETEEWKIFSNPKFYKRPGYVETNYTLVVVFEEEGILFKRMYTL